MPSVSLAFKLKGEEGIEILKNPDLAANITKFKAKTNTLELGRDILLGESKRLLGHVGRHPWKNRESPGYPPLIFTCQSIMGRLQSGSSLEQLSVLQTDRLDHSLAIVGGPVVNSAASLILGHDGGRSPLLGIQLPVGIDTSRLPKAIQNRVEDWRFIIDGRHSDDECLLITSLPMRVENRMERLLNITSLHGPGHYALDQILGSEKMLDELRRRTQGKLAWQAIFKVTVHHDNSASNVSINADEINVYEIVGADFDTLPYMVNDNVLIELIHNAGTDLYRNSSDGGVIYPYAPHSGVQGRELNEKAYYSDLDREVASEVKQLWVADGKGKMNPSEFVRFVYRKWLDNPNFQRAHITRRDFPLSEAYASWIRPERHPEDDLGIPAQPKIPATEQSRREQRARRNRAYRARRRAGGSPVPSH